MFFVFEGLDGCGKSTLIKGFKAYLESQGQGVVVTREPGGTPLGDHLREILLTIKEEGEFQISARSELLIYEASRAQHVEQVIRPALKKGQYVLCDRFAASSVAFQAGGRDLEIERVHELNAFAISGCKPDMQFFIDLKPSECRKRKLSMAEAPDRLESEGADFHNRVYNSYLNQVNTYSQEWVVLDGQLGPDDLLQALIEVCKQKYVSKFK